MMKTTKTMTATAGWRAALAALAALLTMCVPTARAQFSFHDLTIDVVLHDDGSATVTEHRHATIGEKGTEGYIVIGNLGDMELLDFGVSEKGKAFANENGWDVDRTREEKAWRCGIVDKGGKNYELCWGCGDEGEHHYVVTYRLTNLVKAYNESDGFNFMFVARNIDPSPERVRVDIRADSVSLDSTNTRIWGFGYAGTILHEGTHVVAESDDYPTEAAVIVLMEIRKGLLHPQATVDGDFEAVKQAAFENSDYKLPADPFEDPADIAMFVALFIPVIAYAFMSHRISVWSRRRRLFGDESTIPYVRTPALGGNLCRTAFVEFEISRNVKSVNRHVIAAYILRLIGAGALRMTAVTEKGGKTARRLGISPGGLQPAPSRSKDDAANEATIFSILKEAAGDDAILSPGEIKAYAKAHAKTMSKTYETLRFPTSQDSVYTVSRAEGREALGMKKFLKDFTLVNERGMMEVKLWNEYLVYATVFGIADQVMKDIRTVTPDYYDLSDFAKTFDEIAEISDFVDDFAETLVASYAIAYRISNPVTYRSSDYSYDYSGGGGSSSWGGGGGYSGGGSGGGFR